MALRSRGDEPLLVRCVMPPLVVLSVLLGIRPGRAGSASGDGRDQHDGHGVERVVGAVLRNVATQDWLLLGYLCWLLVRVAVHRDVHRSTALGWLAADFLGLGVALVAVRARLVASRVAAVLYRVALFVPVLGSFLQLQWILPAASGPALDARLYALDLRLFGCEPAVAWDRFVSPHTTEWFAFFYYGYFFLIAVHLFPMLILGRGARLRAFGLGFLWVYCAGHVLYTIVPAYGPYEHLAGTFVHPLEGGLWWNLVQSAVASVDGSHRTDVFPSLHTAVPTFLATFSFLHREHRVFRYTWLPVTLFATQMIGATMFLRWHYLVDVVAGVALAASAFPVARLGDVWDRARVEAGGPDVW